MADDPLSDDDFEDYDWGDDDGDLEHPVRAHVAAALVKTADPYPPPLDRLLALGSPHNAADPDPAELGITQDHVPDLVRMARDRALHTDPEDSARSWAPIWALQLLAHFDASASVDELVLLYDIDNEWFLEGLTDVFKPVAQHAFGALAAYVQDSSRWIYGRGYALGDLRVLQEADPGLRPSVVQVLSSLLGEAAHNDAYINAVIIAELLAMRAVEALPLMRQAFELQRVNWDITGDWLEVLGALGVAPDPEDPLVIATRANPRPRGMLGQAPAGLPLFSAGRPDKKHSAAKKKKAKRKMAKASRKANKKKR